MQPEGKRSHAASRAAVTCRGLGTLLPRGRLAEARQTLFRCLPSPRQATLLEPLSSLRKENRRRATNLQRPYEVSCRCQGGTMAYAAEASQPKIIVVPRPLEGYFFERLSRHYADRSDVRVVVDRRVGERRRSDRYVCGQSPLSERRGGDRRADRVSWSLPELPFSFS